MSYIMYISNKSKFVNPSDFNNILTAINALLPTFCKHWNILCPVVLQHTNSTNMSNNMLISLIDSNMLGIYTKGEIEVKPILDNGGVILYKDDMTPTLASFVFSEICNTLIDPSLSGWWVDFKSNSSNPTFYANEVCDQVSDNIVKITVGNQGSQRGVVVGLCDFILPAWTGTNPKNTQFNYMNTLSGPFEHSKCGSLIKFTPTHGIVQSFGEDIPNWLKNLRKESYKYNARGSFNKFN